MISPLLIILLSLLLGVTALSIRSRQKQGDLSRLYTLFEEEIADSQEISWRDLSQLSAADDTFGRAGLFNSEKRDFFKKVKLFVPFVTGFTGIVIGYKTAGVLGSLFGAGIGFYLGVVFWLILIRYLTVKAERKSVLELPVLLESLILLVESGLGLLPALHQLVTTEQDNSSSVRYFFKLVHELSARGMPFGTALESVADRCPYTTLRHVFLHLDIGGNEGGALGPALRSLSQYAHTEWRLSVETRVRRLENLVVFPVFGAVIGLILLSAAVPLVPLMELKDRLDSPPPTIEFAPGNEKF